MSKRMILLSYLIVCKAFIGEGEATHTQDLMTSLEEGQPSPSPNVITEILTKKEEESFNEKNYIMFLQVYNAPHNSAQYSEEDLGHT